MTSSTLFFDISQKNTKPEVGCSGKSQQHRLLPPSFPPTSSLSTPYSFTSIFHPSRYSLITFFSSFINQVSVFLLFSELNLPSPRPISMHIPPRHQRKTHTYQHSWWKETIWNLQSPTPKFKPWNRATICGWKQMFSSPCLLVKPLPRPLSCDTPQRHTGRPRAL